MKKLFGLIWVILFLKNLLFWLWLWQLKEYHFKRFRAHFETQGLRKIISSFWRIKFPRFTKKIIAVLLTGVILEIIFLYSVFSFSEKEFYLVLVISFLLSPLLISLLVLSFQIPVFIWRKRILKKAAEKRRRFKDLVVIGITGSYGKSSTKEFLSAILSEKFKVLKTPQNINAEIGIAKIILKNLNESHQVFIAEIGAYERGKIREVCQMIKPQIGILTGINEQHMSTFGSQENIIKGKYELIESLPPNGLAVFNGNNGYCRNLYKATKIPKVLASFPPHPHNTILTIVKKLLPWEREGFMMALAVAEFLGMTKEEILRGAEKVRTRLKIKKTELGLNIIESTYSANPTGVIAHLDFLKTLQGRKICVMPCLIELGTASKRVHQKIGEKIGEVCSLAIVTTKDWIEDIKRGAQRVGMDPDRIVFLNNPQKIFEKIKNSTKENDIVLLEGRVPSRLTALLLEGERE